MGGKTKYTVELAKRICDALETGKTLRAVCREEGLPDEATVRNWVSEDRNGFAPQYLRAREIGYQAMADEILAIADEGENDTYTDEHGKTKTDWDVLGRSKLRCDMRQWLLSKALPKIYGQKITSEMTGKDGEPLFPSEDREKRLRLLEDTITKRLAQKPEASGVDDLV